MHSKTKIIGEGLPSPGRIEIGDVLAIPLGDDIWGYVRSVHPTCFAILDSISDGSFLPVCEIIGHHALEYTAYCEPRKRPNWIYLGRWPLEQEDNDRAPPEYSIDIIDSSIFTIHHNGEVTRTSDPNEIKGLKRHEGLLMPGSLVAKMRALFDLPVDKELIGKFAPFTSNWTPPQS